jgi:predicted GTPase
VGFERALTHEVGLAVFRRGSPGALALLRAVWPSVVGPELGQRTEVLGVVEDTLRIGVPDARWRTALHRLQATILQGLREQAGALAPRRLGFVEGVTPVVAADRRQAPERTRAECPPVPEALAREARVIADPELRAAFLDTASRYLARRELAEQVASQPFPSPCVGEGKGGGVDDE